MTEFADDTRVSSREQPDNVVSVKTIEAGIRSGAIAVLEAARRLGVSPEGTASSNPKNRASAYCVVANIALELAITADPDNALAASLLDAWQALSELVALTKAAARSAEQN